MSQKRNILLGVIAGTVLLAITSIILVQKQEKMAAARGLTNSSCVVIDAGHGGDDPGKVGINKALEKDINLEIAKLLKKYLEANDINVVMTREDDHGLYDSGKPNKKVQDMKERIKIIENSNPLLTVSIHQNSFPEEYVHGAQVFYYSGSEEGKKLAEKVQIRLNQMKEADNKRQMKANNSYYLLKKTKTPIIIVECGFLSNKEEAEKLISQNYQKKIAWEIALGMIQYLNDKE